MNLLRLLGREKYKFIRVMAYLGIYNAIMLTYLAGWHWWYLMLIPIFGGLYYFESKFGIPGELDVAWKSSKIWTDYEIRFNELQRKFDELYERLMP